MFFLYYSGDHLFWRVPNLFVSDVQTRSLPRTCIDQLFRGCLEWGDECSSQSRENEVEADDGPLEEVNEENEEAEERKKETEMEEMQKKEHVRED